MNTVTLSRKFQIVFPASVRKALKLKPGQKIHVIERDGHIELRALRPMEEYFGFLPGIDTDVPRDHDRV